jgi:hypothetical protein
MCLYLILGVLCYSTTFTFAGIQRVEAIAQHETLNSPGKEVYFLPEELGIMNLASGSGQQQSVSLQLVEELIITVIDQFDNPIPDLVISFELVATPNAAQGMRMFPRHDQSLGKATPGTEALSVPVVSSTTDSLGQAAINFVVGDRPGDYIIMATSPTINSIEFIVTGLPDSYTLRQNYPNPFNPSTNIVFDLPVESIVKLTVYDMLGRRVATLSDGTLPMGLHVVELNAGALGMASGMYIYRLEALGISTNSRFVTTKKMLFIK